MDEASLLATLQAGSQACGQPLIVAADAGQHVGPLHVAGATASVQGWLPGTPWDHKGRFQCEAACRSLQRRSPLANSSCVQGSSRCAAASNVQGPDRCQAHGAAGGYTTWWHASWHSEKLAFQAAVVTSSSPVYFAAVSLSSS